MALQTLLNSIKERNFSEITKQTEKLDPQTRQHLQEYLQSNLGSTAQEQEKELEELQDELDMASTRLRELEEKEEFIGTRLRAYQAKLKAIQTGTTEDEDEEDEPDDNDDDGDSNPPPPPTLSPAKQQEHAKSLEEIQRIHNAMKHNIAVLEKKVVVMERRKLELTLQLEECQAVLKTTKEMEQAETELAFEEATDGVVTDDDRNDVTIPVHTQAIGSSRKQLVDASGDPEAGGIELTTYELDVKDGLVNTSKDDDDEEEEEKKIVHKEEGVEDALESRLTIADEQV